MSIFPIHDLDIKLLEQLDLIDDYHRMIINKYYHGLIIDHTLYKKIIKLHHYNKTHVCEFASKNESLFINSCQTNNILISQYLIKKYPNINIHADNDHAFKLSCANGHLNMARWLLWQSQQNGFTLVNIHAENDFAFRWSCRNGHLMVAQWLLWQSQQPGFTLVDIHYYHDSAFRWSCGNGHLLVTQWLLWQSQQQGFTLVDIHALNDFAFNMSRNNGHLLVTQWLNSL